MFTHITPSSPTCWIVWGGFYTLNDILTSIAEGKTQSFMEGDSWVVTKIVNFPRARLLEIMVALGNIDECRALHDRILDFAREDDIRQCAGLWSARLESLTLKVTAGR